jgi:hypothetical protein
MNVVLQPFQAAPVTLAISTTLAVPVSGVLLMMPCVDTEIFFTLTAMYPTALYHMWTVQGIVILFAASRIRLIG